MNIIMVEIRNNAFIRYNTINVLNIELDDFVHYFVVNTEHIINKTQPTYSINEFIRNPKLFKTGLFKMFDTDAVDSMNINYFLILNERYIKQICEKTTNIPSDIIQKFISKYNIDNRNQKLKELIKWLK